MSALVRYDEQGEPCGEVLREHGKISSLLQKHGVRFERWRTEQPLPEDAGQEDVLATYVQEVADLNREYGFQSVDVVSLRSNHPEKESLRSKFLAEHTHDDFEVRFFVDGRGLFYLHIDTEIYLVLCEKGDLISVPAGVAHWFDMGVDPDFKCIRFFTVTDGWQAQFTESDIATRFPDFDRFIEQVEA